MRTTTVRYGPLPYSDLLATINRSEEDGWAVRQMLACGEASWWVIYERENES
jgi:hypothetical protein